MATVDESRQAVDLVQQQISDWEGKIGATEAEIAALERNAGVRVANAEDGAATAASIAAELGTKRAFIEVARQAKSALASKREQAEIDLLIAHADEMNAQAAEKRRAADARQVRTDELLHELHEWEQCEYVPRRPVTSDPPITVNPQTGRAEVIAGGAVKTTFVIIPITQALRNEADALDNRAQIMREQAERRQHTLNAKSRARISPDAIMSRMLAKVGSPDWAAWLTGVVPDVAAHFAMDEGGVVDAIEAAAGGDLSALARVGVTSPLEAWSKFKALNNGHRWRDNSQVGAEMRARFLRQQLLPFRGTALRLGA